MPIDDAYSQDDPPTDEELERRKWKHRRRLAYFGLIGPTFIVVVFVTLAIVSPDTIAIMDAVAPVVGTYMFGSLALPAAYMGFSTWSGMKTGGKR